MDVEAADLGTVPVYVPAHVLAGGFMVVDGFQVVPISNGVMQPGREILNVLASMFVANGISDAETRGQVLARLADLVAAKAEELKTAVSTRS